MHRCVACYAEKCLAKFCEHSWLVLTARQQNEESIAMFRIKLRQLGTTAVSVAALMTMALIAPGAAFAQRTITIVIPEEPDSLDNCNSARSAVGRVIRQNVNETLIELHPNDSSLTQRLRATRDVL